MPLNDSHANKSDHTTAINDTTAQPRRRKYACVECRQQKSKCDAHERAPNPCTKCSKKGLPCVLKKEFKRTYKRARNEAIEQKFKELTKNLTKINDKELLEKLQREQLQILDNSNFTKDKIRNSTTSSNSNNNSNSDLKQLNISNSTSALYQNLNSSFNTIVTDEINIINKLTDDQLSCNPKSLGDVVLTSEDIKICFQEFVSNYHQFLPVVDLTKGCERIYSLSPALFWVIILISLRRVTLPSDFDKKISNKLNVLVKNILAEITISPIIRYTPMDNDEPLLNVASVYSVQAFLLYTFWPPLTSSLSADTSWNTIGTAMFQAIRVGLNSVDFSKEYATTNSELIKEQRRTWICCNIVSQIIAATFGFPAYVSFDNIIMNSTRNINSANHSNLNDNKNMHDDNRGTPNSNFSLDLPIQLKQMIQIMHFDNQMISTLNSNPLNKMGICSSQDMKPLLNVLHQQLVQLELNLTINNNNNKLDNIRTFLLLVSKVHLLTYYFNDSKDSTINNNSNTSTNRFNTNTSFDTNCGLVKCYSAAIKLLLHANEMTKNDINIIKYFPGCFILTIWQAACIITKLIHSSLRDLVDIEKGKEAYKIATKLTLNASVLKYDMAYRSSGIMRSIWSLFAQMYHDWQEERQIKKHKKDGSYNEFEEFNLTITVKSRMSVSVFFDCLYILKAKCGMAKLQREKKYNSRNSSYVKLESNQSSNGSEANSETNSLNNENDNGQDLDVEVMNDEDINRDDSKKDLTENQARRLISMIPLDPNPINAGNTLHNNRLLSNVTTISPMENRSPLSVDHLTKMYSLLDAIPSQIMHYAMPGQNQPSHNQEHESKKANNDTSNGKSNDASQYVDNINQENDTIYPLSESLPLRPHNKIGLSYLKSEKADNVLTPKSQPQQLHDTNVSFGEVIPHTESQRESPTMLESWDNWESDMVWKDVDILMNEFAFNPSV